MIKWLVTKRELRDLAVQLNDNVAIEAHQTCSSLQSVISHVSVCDPWDTSGAQGAGYMPNQKVVATWVSRCNNVSTETGGLL